MAKVMTAEAKLDADPRRKSWDRRLHQTYSRSTSLQHFLHRRVCPAGFATGAVFVLIFCLAAGQQKPPIYQMLSLSTTILALSLPLAMSRRARLHAERLTPRHASMGLPLRYTVRVTNTGRSGLSRAWLMESLPDPRPSIEEFVRLREPGEEERNAFDRSLAWFRWQWLVSRKRLFTGGDSPAEIRLRPGDSMNATVEIVPQRRGVIRMDRLEVRLPDPLGIFQSIVRVEGPASTVIVLPRRYRLPPVELPGSAAFQLSGESNTNAIGNSGEFTGLREYRPGDPVRQIHWKSWARMGRPIIKELEDTFYPRHGLVLDTLSTHPHDAGFEECVSVAASFASSLDTGDTLLDLMFVNNQAHMVTAGRGVERGEKLLEVLAGVHPSREDHLNELARLVIRHSADLTSCVVILNGWDKAREDFLAQLRTVNLLFTVLAVGHGPRPDGLPGLWLDAGQIERQLQQLPPRLPLA